MAFVCKDFFDVLDVVWASKQTKKFYYYKHTKNKNFKFTNKLINNSELF